MIHQEREGAVIRLIIDRPERRNALNVEIVDGLDRGIAVAADDPDCRCLVIKGAGEHFCAGRDLAAPGGDRGLVPILARDETWTRIFHRLHKLAKPSVAVVRGYAVAGGFTLAMGCDFVLAETGARFGALEMRNNFPAAVNTPILTHLAGPRVALEFAMLGEFIEAPRLHQMGLINRLAADAEELTRIEVDFVAALVALDPHAVALTKETHRAAASMPLEDALVMGKHLNALLAASGRIDEGAQAFAARRKRKKDG